MHHGHHTWHRGRPFHESACSMQFLSESFTFQGHPAISKQYAKVTNIFNIATDMNLTTNVTNNTPLQILYSMLHLMSEIQCGAGYVANLLTYLTAICRSFE